MELREFGVLVAKYRCNGSEIRLSSWVVESAKQSVSWFYVALPAAPFV